MSDSPEMFDPYWEWLEIPPEDQPPTFYRLLGLDDFEDDLATIDDAAKQTTAYLHPMAAGPNRESVQNLLSEVAKARRTLLGSDAKQAYDESLQVEQSTPEAPPLSIPPVEENTVSQNEATTSDSADEDQEAAEPQPYRPLRKKSLLNDWRVHVISASVLFLGAIGFVYYNNRKAKRVASVAATVPKSRQASKSNRSVPAPKRDSGAELRSANTSSDASDSVMPRAPKKPKARSSGQSALELMLAQDGLSMESAKGPENAMRRGGSRSQGESDKKQEDKDELPEYKEIDLPENWLNGLQVINKFEMPLNQMFNDANLNSGLVAAGGKLMVQPTKPLDKVATLTLKGKSVGLGETVAVKTNMNSDTAKNVRVGLAVGGLRIILRAASPLVEVKINNEKAGELASENGKGIVLAVTRDSKNEKRFHWIAQSGNKAVFGSGVFTPGLKKTATIGVLAKCGEKKPLVAVAINEFAFGKLGSKVAFSETEMLEVSPKPK